MVNHFSCFMLLFPSFLEIFKGLTPLRICVIFSMKKAVTKTCVLGKILREEPLGEKALNPCP